MVGEKVGYKNNNRSYVFHLSFVFYYWKSHHRLFHHGFYFREQKLFQAILLQEKKKCLGPRLIKTPYL